MMLFAPHQAATVFRVPKLPGGTTLKRAEWEIAHSASEHGPRLHLPKIPRRGNYSEAARLDRLQFIRQQTSKELASIGAMSLDPAQLSSNMEALIGSVEIPLGLAGPLMFHGEHAQGLVYAPIAATEGALVSSITRGAYAISISGGVQTRVMRQRMVRVPMFLLADMREAQAFADFVTQNFERIRAVTRRYSNYADLKELPVQLLGRAAHVHFVYETGDAAGQNMTTTCTWHACLWLVAQVREALNINAENFLVEGGMASDKKVSNANLIKGRGISVQAEACISRSAMRRVLKIEPEDLQRYWQHSMSAAISSGMLGLNTNVANLVAAVFAATGQDLASVHESSSAVLSLEVKPDGDLYLALSLPSLVIGTIGGGTHLPDQRECLELLGCQGTGKVKRLAEIIAGYALSLDISTMSAIVAGHFAIAHEKLGRSNQGSDFKLGELDAKFFNHMLEQNPGWAEAGSKVIDAEPLSDVSIGDSVLSELASKRMKKAVGLFPFRLQLANPQHRMSEIKVMVKLKPRADEVSEIACTVAALCGEPLASEFQRCRAWLGNDATDRKELAIFAQTDARFQRYTPRMFGQFQHERRGAFILVQELLQNLELMDSAQEIESWTLPHWHAALTGISACQAIWYQREAELQTQTWLGNTPSLQLALEKQSLYRALLQHATDEFPEQFSGPQLLQWHQIIDGIGGWWAEIEQMPRTLVHHDFNPRNMGFRREAKGLRVCIYDWELANLHLPQRDLVELLAYTLQADTPAQQVEDLVNFHRRALQTELGHGIDAKQWWRGFRYALYDFMLATILVYLMMHTFRHFAYLERVLATTHHLLAIVQEQEA